MQTPHCPKHLNLAGSQTKSVAGARLIAAEHVFFNSHDADNGESKQFLTQLYILLLNGFKHMLKDLLQQPTSVMPFWSNTGQLNQIHGLMGLVILERPYLNCRRTAEACP